LWPQLVEAASFESMRRDGALLMPHLGGSFTDGANSFFFAGRNGRWREMLTKDDLAAYDAKIVASLSLACARWVAVGGLVAEDPQMDLRNSAS
jgi:aryl sulfotransferase